MRLCSKLYNDANLSEINLDKDAWVMKRWFKVNAADVSEWFNIVNEIKSSSNNGFSIFSIASRHLDFLTRLN